MGPKKAGKKGGAKKKGGEFDLDLNEQNVVLEAMQESLQASLASKQIFAERCKAAEYEKRKRDMDLLRTVNEEKKKYREIIADMTRQYKAIEEEKSQ